MATTFEFRRHSLKDGPTAATIGPKGNALAREVGRTQLRGRGFAAYYASDYWRTMQTLAAFGEGAGDFAMLKFAPKMPPIYGQTDEVWRMWQVCRAAEKRGEDMVQAALAHDAALAEGAGTEFARQFIEWSMRIEPETTVLVVGHSPHIELMAFGLDGRHMPGLRECQGVRIVMTDPSPPDPPGPATYAVDRTSPGLDPSAIRARLFP